MTDAPAGTPEATVLGMPIPGADSVCQPIGAVVCVKGLDAAGGVAYWTAATDGLSVTEAIGMALGLLDDLRDARRNLGADGDEDDAG